MSFFPKCTPKNENVARVIAAIVLLGIPYLLGWVFQTPWFLAFHLTVGLFITFLVLLAWLSGDLSFCKKH